MAGLILGIVLLTAPFFTASHLGVSASTCLAISGGALTLVIAKIESASSKIFPVKDDQVAKNLPPRRYPPLSLFDTVRITINDQGEQVIESMHGTCNIFKDKEILEFHPVLRQEILGERINLNTREKEIVYIDFTENEKAIIQQQATRGCTAATAAMLIKDQGGTPDLFMLESRNLGNDEDIEKNIHDAGFELVITSFETGSLESLRKQLLKYGSAIVSIWDPQASSHSIVVDEVFKDLSQLRLRDPYHGWEITVTAEAFQSRWDGKKVIQIE